MPPTRALLVLAAGFSILFVGAGARLAIGLTLKPMVEELGWERRDLGAAVAAFHFVSAAAMYGAGLLADRMSLRTLLGGGLLAGGIGITLMSLVSTPWQAVVLYGCVFALGSGAASIVPVSVMVTRTFVGRTGLANAIVSSGMSVGQLLMIAALTAVLAQCGWRPVFWALGACHLALLPAAWSAIPPGVAPGRRSEAVRAPATPPLRDAARTRQLWLLLLVYGVCGLGDFFVATHVVAYAQDTGISAYVAGSLLALMGLTGLLGVVAAGYWSDRSGPVWPTVACFAARVASFALVLVDQSSTAVTIFALVFGLTFLVTAPLTVIFVRDMFGSDRLGALTGLVTMVHHTMGGIGAYLGASVFDATRRYDAAFVVMLATSALAAALAVALRRPARRSVP